MQVGTSITIAISLAIGDGRYDAVVPELIADAGTELNAVLLQAVFSLLYGAAFGGASLIWETERSLLRMTVTHLAVCSIATFPIAYWMRWMEHSLGGVLKYFGIFAAVYAVIWVTQYAGMKRKVRSINQKVNEIK